MKLLHPSNLTIVFLLTFFSAIITASTPATADPRVEIQASFTPPIVRPQASTVLSVQLRVPDGFILYSPTVIPDGPLPLRMEVINPGPSALGPWFGDTPNVKWDDAFEQKVEYYKTQATFRRSFRIPQSLTSPILLKVEGQICDHKSCFNQTISTEVPLTIDKDAAVVTIPSRLQGVAFDSAHSVGEITSSGSDDGTDSIGLSSPNRPETIGIWAFLLMAIVAGFGALLTPCVFPMIPITISFFSKNQSLPSRTNLFLAAIYAGSIILVYTIPGVVISMLFGAGSMQQIATHPIFNVFITAVLLFFGLNLLGLFELRLPSSLINKSAQKEQSLSSESLSLRSRMAGVFFMAVTFTLVSFSCTVGFVGGWVLPLAARGEAFYPLIGMLAFSSAFALPFFFLAVFPTLATRLQGKSGDWMVAIKVVFGVVELAAAMKFISNLDLHFQMGLVSRSVVLSIWVAVFLIGALIVLKVFEKGPAISRPGATRIVLAVVLLGFAIKSGTGLGNNRPMGGWVDGWLPPVPYPGTDDGVSNDTATDTTGALSFFEDDLKGAMTEAVAQNKPLFVDFTGYQCANCRQMESNIFPGRKVREQLSQMVRVKLYTDGPKPIHRQQREYQFSRFNTAVLPFYVIIDSRTDDVLATFSSLAENEEVFVRFLIDGQKRFAARTQPPANTTTAEGETSNSQTLLMPSGPKLSFTLPGLLSGESVSSSSFAGTWTLVNFWASFCAPCKKELTEAFPSALQANPDIQLVTIAVEPEETVDSARNFIQSLPIDRHTALLATEEWPSQTLSSELQKDYGLPSSFLLNQQGEVVWRHNGSITESLLKELLEQITR